MIISILNEGPKEARVAITPSAVKHYLKLGLEVQFEKNAGLNAGFSNEDYLSQGANLKEDSSGLLSSTNILVSVNQPDLAILKNLAPKTLIISHVDDSENQLMRSCTEQELSLFSMNKIPRISRAQSMDSLSSQANLAGYRAVLEALHYFKKAVPMMMTAAGMVQPAKVLILGAGVAGLQAIATAKRIGAVVKAFDVRPTVKEQVESLGAEFVEVARQEEGEDKGGYAKEMSAEYMTLQAQLIHEEALAADIIICTALIPGKKAPLLIHKKTVEQMKSGAVIVDLAASHGGNCELSEAEKVSTNNGIKIIGYSNLAGLIATTASELYSTNILNLMRILIKDKTLDFNPEDEIIQQALLCYEGKYLPFQNHKEAVVWN